MTALSAPKQISNNYRRPLFSCTLPVKAGEIIYAGAAIAVVAGKWQNVTATTGLGGRYAEAVDTVDNTADGKVLEGKFYEQHGKHLAPFVNDTVAPILAANMGDEVYFVDNQTVSIDDAGGTRSAAGRVWKFGSKNTFDTDTTYVWVEVK